MQRNSLLMFNFAWQNFLKRKGKSLFIITIAAFGVAAVVLSISFIQTLGDTWQELFSREFCGDLLITTAQKKEVFFDKKHSKILSTMPEEQKDQILDVLKSSHSVVAFSPRLRGEGLIYLREVRKFKAISFFGVNPIEEPRVTTAIKIIAGKYLSDEFPCAIIPQVLAEKENLNVGDEIIIFARNIDDFFIPYKFKITGIYSAPIHDYFAIDGFIMIDQDGACALLGLKEGAIQEIAIKLKDPTKTFMKNINEKIKKTIPINFVPTYRTMLFYEGMISFYRLICVVIIGVVFLIVAIGIFTTQFARIIRRKKEIGTMLAIGAQKEHVLSILIFETIIEGVISFGLGSILSIFAAFLINKIDLLNQPFFQPIFIVPTSLQINVVSFVVGFIVVLMVTIIASFYPTWKATKLEPVVVLREI